MAAKPAAKKPAARSKARKPAKKPATKSAAKKPADEFRTLCEELECVEDAALDDVLPTILASQSLPAELCRGDVHRIRSSAPPWTRQSQVQERGPVAGWLWDLFDGRVNPRLALLRRAYVTCEDRYDRTVEDPWSNRWGTQSPSSLLLAMARHFEPTFSYDDTLHAQHDQEWPGHKETLHAYGDARRRFTDRSYELEHAGDSSYGNEYTMLGLADARVSLEIVRRSGSHTYNVCISGPTPAALDLALVWSELQKHGPVLLDQESMPAVVARCRASTSPRG